MSLDFISGILQAGAQGEATQKNAENVQKTNSLNFLMSLMARGEPLTASQAQNLGVPELAGKSSAVLPYYLADIEKATGINAGDMALALQANAPTVGDYSAAIAPYLAQMSDSQKLVGGLLSGGMTQQMLQEQAPVSAATTNVALTQKDTALQQLDETLNQIDAIQARKGYAGDSTGNRMLKFNARANIMGAAAGNIAQANLANAKAVQGIQQQGRALQLSNLNTPASLASSVLQLKEAPTSATSNTFQSTMQPLSFFNVGNHPFTNSPQPLVDKTSVTGLAASGLASGADSALSLGLKSYFNSLNNNGMTTTGDANNTFGSNPNDLAGFGAGAGGGAAVDPSLAAGTDVPAAAPAFSGG